DVGRRDISLRIHQDANFCCITTSEIFQFPYGECFWVTYHPTLRPTIGKPYYCTLPGHPHSERAHLVKRRCRMITNATLSGTKGGIVVHPVAGEDPNRIIIHLNWEIDGQLTFRYP